VFLYNLYSSFHQPNFSITDIQGKILDLGCGGGRNFSYFAGQGFDVYGCDLHEHMVETSRKMVEDIVKPYNYADRVIKANVLVSYSN